LLYTFYNVRKLRKASSSLDILFDKKKISAELNNHIFYSVLIITQRLTFLISK